MLALLNTYKGSVLLLALAVPFLLSRLRQAHRLHSFSERRHWSMRKIYRHGFRDSGLDPQAVHQVWSELAQILGVPPGQLRPEDPIRPRPGAPLYVFGSAVDRVHALLRAELGSGVPLPANMRDSVQLLARQTRAQGDRR